MARKRGTKDADGGGTGMRGNCRAYRLPGRGRDAGPRAPPEGSTVDLDRFEAAAVEVAVAAGRLVRRWAGRPRGLSSKATPADLVTELDREAEAMIAADLRRRFPDHDLYGEEAGGKTAAEFVWYVDPIDGTTNFVHGLPGYSVSVALTQGGRPVAAAVYDPTADEVFSAAVGEGARANGRPLHVERTATLAEALVGTGIPPVQPSKDYAVRSLVAVAARARNLRNLGSAALHLAYVAAGRLTGFWEPALNAWDCAAGVLLVREAGGRATDLAGTDWRAGLRGALGTNGAIHDELLAVLRGVEGPLV